MIVVILDVIFDKNFSKDSRMTIIFMVFGSTIIFEIASYFIKYIIYSMNVEIFNFIIILLIPWRNFPLIWISILEYKEWNSSRKGSKNSFVKVVLIPIFIHPVSKLIRLENLFSALLIYSIACLI